MSPESLASTVTYMDTDKHCFNGPFPRRKLMPSLLLTLLGEFGQAAFNKQASIAPMYIK